MTRRLDDDFGEFFGPERKRGGHVRTPAAAAVQHRIVRAAQNRAAWAERTFEEASAAYVARHLRTRIPAADHEKDRLRALHADVLETRAAAQELAGLP